MFKTYKASFDSGEAELLWDGRDEYCFEIIDHEWKYLFEIMQKTVKNTRNVIQAGGNCGLYPLRLSQYFQKVFTFEPDPVNFFCLSTNCKNHKIVKFNCALGDTCRDVMIGNPQSSNNGMSRILDEGESGNSIYMITLDGLNISDVDLLMLDVEGYEYNALLGAKKTLEENSPVIIIEITKDEIEIDSYLNSMGYQKVGILNSNTQTFVYVKG